MLRYATDCYTTQNTLRYTMLQVPYIIYPTPHCTTLPCPACPALHCAALRCTALHCAALRCAALHCTALHCTALHSTAPLHSNAALASRYIAVQRIAIHYRTSQRAAVHSYIRTFVIRRYAYTCTNRPKPTHAQPFVYLHACIHTCIHTCLLACMHACMHAHMHVAFALPLIRASPSSFERAGKPAKRHTHTHTHTKRESASEATKRAREHVSVSVSTRALHALASGSW